MKIIYIIIAILLSVDNIFIRIKLGGISYDRLLEFLLFFLFIKSFLVELRTNSFFKKWITFLAAFALLQLLINLKLAIVGKILFEDVYTSFIKCLSFIVFSYLFLLIAKKDIKYLNIILFVHFLICIFAFLQYPLSPLADQMLDIKRLLYAQSDVDKISLRLNREDEYISGGYASRFRLSGPFVTTINFSYFAISSFIICFYMYLKSKKRIYSLFLVVLFIASLLSQTRSLLLAEVALVLGYLFFVPLRNSALYKFGIVLLGVISISLLVFIKGNTGNETPGFSRITSIGEEVRPLLWYTGFYAVANNPLGITNKDYQESRQEVFYQFGHPAILYLAPHNGIVNIGFHYSLLGYVLFLFFLGFLLKYINLLSVKSRIFFKLSLFAYLIHISFHNDFILNSDYPFLMVLMLIYIDSLQNEKLKKDLPTVHKTISNRGYLNQN